MSDRLTRWARRLASGACIACAGAPLACEDIRLEFRSIDRLAWNVAAGASSYGLYRGEIDPGGMRAYTHECVATQLPATLAVDREIPDPGRALYYLVNPQWITDAGDVAGGSLGVDSSGHSRPEGGPGSACGARVFVDPDVVVRWHHDEPYVPTGLSWEWAYSSISEAFHHSRTPYRSLELWVRGELHDSGANTIDGLGRGARILGGFGGDEANAWDRDPAAHVTTWDGDGGFELLGLYVQDEHVLLDGLTLRNASVGITHEAPYGVLRVRNVRFEAFADSAVAVKAPFGPAFPILVVERSRFAASNVRAIVATPREAELRVHVADNEFDGALSDVIRLDLFESGIGRVAIGGDIVRNRIRGGEHALVLRANNDRCDGRAGLSIAPLVASNEIRGTRGDAIVLVAEAEVCAFDEGPNVAEVAPLLVANTIVDAGGNGVSCTAAHYGPGADPRAYLARCAPALWDNLVTHAAGYAFREGADDVEAGLDVAPLLVGNDLWACSGLYLAGGALPLASIAEVNALAGNRENLAADPLYRDRAGADLRLLPGSPAIDRGHAEGLAYALLDVTRALRTADGDGDGCGKPDLGANERGAP